MVFSHEVRAHASRGGGRRRDRLGSGPGRRPLRRLDVGRLALVGRLQLVGRSPSQQLFVVVQLVLVVELFVFLIVQLVDLRRLDLDDLRRLQLDLVHLGRT
jgi:hypothetical protein